MKVVGKVISVAQATRTSKAGKQYSVWVVELENGTKLEYGFKQPAYPTGDPVCNGDRIAATAEQKYGKWQVDMGMTLDGEDEPDTAAPAAPAKKSWGGGGGGSYKKAEPTPFPIPKTHGREISIIRQNALTNARELIVGTSLFTSTPTDAEIDALAERTIEVAYKFAEFSSGDRERKMGEELMKVRKVSA